MFCARPHFTRSASNVPRGLHPRPAYEPDTNAAAPLPHVCVTIAGGAPSPGQDAWTVAFGAGETREIAALRRYLRHERGLDAERVRMVAYWKRASAAAS